MSSAKPLSGKRIVITRAPDDASELRSLLESSGAQILLFPLVRFAPPSDWRPVDDELRRIRSFGAILFLSRNAVGYVAERSRGLGMKWDFTGPEGPFVAVVGRGTRDRAVGEGIAVDFEAKNQNAASLVRELGSRLKGRTVFLPRGDRGDRELSDALEAAGARVREVVAYRTVGPENPDPVVLDRICRADVDAVVFASPSAFRNLCDLIPGGDVLKLSSKIDFAAIGPTTARALRHAGVRVEIEARDPSAAGIASALVSHYESRTAGERGT